MTSRHTIWGIYLAMVISIFMLIFVSWLAYDRIQETVRRTESVNHTYRVRLKNKDLLVALLNIETGQRGYLITQLEGYLTPYAKSRHELKSVQKALRLLTKDNEVQLARVDTLDVLINKKLSVIEQGIANIKNGLLIDTLRMQEGRLYMDEIRRVSQRFDTEERKLLTYRAELQKLADRHSNYYLFLLSGVSLVFLLLFFRLLYIELRRRIGLQTRLEQKLTELEHANTELEQFAYVASHDLQEPLRKIQSFGERLKIRQGDQLNEDGKTNLLKINQSAARMQQLIDDLLIFSRTANLRERIFEEINLNELLEEVKEEFSETIREKKATIISDALPNITGVRFQIVQLFSNLISNSIKYAKADKAPVIEIKFKNVNGQEIEGVGNLQQDNIFYQISFIDNGIGFDPIYSEKIFVIFQRLHNRSEYQGTGIGLALCRRIVTNHNGYIIAKARPKQAGAIFHIYLPKL